MKDEVKTMRSILIFDRLQWALLNAANKVRSTGSNIRLVYFSWSRHEYVDLVKPCNDFRRILGALKPDMVVEDYGWTQDGDFLVEVSM